MSSVVMTNGVRTRPWDSSSSGSKYGFFYTRKMLRGREEDELEFVGCSIGHGRTDVLRVGKIELSPCQPKVSSLRMSPGFRLHSTRR